MARTPAHVVYDDDTGQLIVEVPSADGVGDVTLNAISPVSRRLSLQESINKCAASGGGVVQLPVGATRVSEPVQMRSRVTIAGPPGEVTVWGYSSDPRPFHTAWLEADRSDGPVVEFGGGVVGAGLRNLLIHAGGRRAINAPDSPTRTGNSLERVIAHGGDVYLGSKEWRAQRLIVTSAPGDGLTIAGHDSRFDEILVGHCGGNGVVLAATSGPTRLSTLDTFHNAGDGLQINGHAHRLVDIQANNNARRGITFLTATGTVILGVSVTNNSREDGLTAYPDVTFAHPSAGNIGCGIVGGVISNDGEASYGVDRTEAVASFPLLCGVYLGGTYSGGASPFALVNGPSAFRVQGCVGVPDVMMPQGGVSPKFRTNGSADIVQVVGADGVARWSVNAAGIIGP